MNYLVGNLSHATGKLFAVVDYGLHHFFLGKLIQAKQ